MMLGGREAVRGGREAQALTPSGRGTSGQVHRTRAGGLFTCCPWRRRGPLLLHRIYKPTSTGKTLLNPQWSWQGLPGHSHGHGCWLGRPGPCRPPDSVPAGASLQLVLLSSALAQAPMGQSSGWSPSCPALPWSPTPGPGWPTPINVSFMGMNTSPSREGSSHFSPSGSVWVLGGTVGMWYSVNIHQVYSQFSKYFQSFDRGQAGCWGWRGLRRCSLSQRAPRLSPRRFGRKCTFRVAGEGHGDQTP